MILYYSKGACSLASHIALLEAGFTPKLVKVNLKTKETEDGSNFLEVTSKGYVPALQNEAGDVITEGPVILQYIADLKPDSQLLPAVGTLERIRVQEWLNFIATELHKNFSPLFNPTASSDWRNAAIAKLDKNFSWLDKQLVDNDFLMGAQFTVADCYLFTVSRWCAAVGVDITHLSNLGRLFNNAMKRSSVQAALQAEGIK